MQSSGNMYLSRRVSDGLALAACLLFVVLGCLWIDHIGLQNDELLFGAGIYPPFNRQDSVRIFGHELPLMVMTYVGTLKAMVYRLAVFPFWDPSPYSVRVPAVLLGAWSIWIFYRLMIRCADHRLALGACALLATDASYLLTSRWDWGPVVLQHLCLLGGLLALANFVLEGRKRIWLVAAFFCFGLGLWDKTLFIWALVGLAAASLCVARREVRELLQPRVAVLAMVAFLLGALPLVIYNVRHKAVTFRSNSDRWEEPTYVKAWLMRLTLEGSAIFASIVRDPSEEPAKPLEPGLQTSMAELNDWLGNPREGFGFYALAAAVLVLPFAGKMRRPALFALIFGAVTWAQMLPLREGGTGAHHTTLIWPAPQAVIALCLGGTLLRWRRFGPIVFALVVISICCSNLAVLTTYYTNMLRFGSVVAWTDAIYPTVSAIGTIRPKQVCVLDWGFYEPVRTLHKGSIGVCAASDPVSDDAKKYATLLLHDAGNLYVGHTPTTEFNKGAVERFVQFADSIGFKQTDVRVFQDSNGRDIIQMFRMTPK